MDEIRRVGGDDIVGMTPTIIVPGMLSFQVRGETITRQVNLIGIDRADPRPGQRLLPVLATSGKSRDVEFQPAGRGLRRPRSSGRPGGHLASRDGDCRLETPPVASHSAEGDRAQHGPPPAAAGQADPSGASESAQARPDQSNRSAGRGSAADDPRDGRCCDRRGASNRPASAAVANADATQLDPDKDIFDRYDEPEKVFDPEHEQHTGAVLGIALANFRTGEGKEGFRLLPGDDVTLLCRPPAIRPRARWTISRSSISTKAR